MPDLRPIYLSRPVADTAALAPVLDAFGLPMPARPHITLIYSTHPVDWDLPVFLPDTDTITLPLPHAHLQALGPDRDLLALRFDHPIFAARNRALIRFGARSDWPHFHAHITLGPAPDGWSLTPHPLPSHLTFGPEVRKAI